MRRALAALMLVMSASAIGPVTQTAHATDLGAEAAFASRINSVRVSRGLGALTSHSVLTAKAQSWAQHMASSGCLCHSNLPDGVTVGWRALAENIGRGPSVDSIHNALVNSPSHLANMVGPYRWVGVGVAYGNGQMYVAEVFMDGNPPPGPSPLLAFDATGRAIAARPQGGFWLMNGNGTVAAYEGAPNYGSPRFPGDFGRDIVSMPDGNGYVILDSLGGVHRFGSAIFTLAGVGGPWFGFDIARAIAVTPDGKGFTVLDGYGGLHPYGTAKRLSGAPYWPGWDIAKSIAYTPGGGLYLLDSFGGLWGLGGAKHYGTTYFGWNIARDIAVWSDGKGYGIIDGFGGIHRFGSAKTSAGTPYQTIDRWRSIVVQGGTYLALRNDGIPVRV